MDVYAYGALVAVVLLPTALALSVCVLSSSEQRVICLAGAVWLLAVVIGCVFDQILRTTPAAIPLLALSVASGVAGFTVRHNGERWLAAGVVSACAALGSLLLPSGFLLQALSHVTPKETIESPQFGYVVLTVVAAGLAVACLFRTKHQKRLESAARQLFILLMGMQAAFAVGVLFVGSTGLGWLPASGTRSDELLWFVAMFAPLGAVLHRNRYRVYLAAALLAMDCEMLSFLRELAHP